MTGRVFEYHVPRERRPHQFLTPQGICIYCGSAGNDEQALTKEHVIPDGIGGDLILPDASCIKCARKIQPFETFVQTHEFGITRDLLGISSRKRRKRDYISKNVYSVRDDAERFEELSQGIGKLPVSTVKSSDVFHKFVTCENYFHKRPGIIRGADKRENNTLLPSIIGQAKDNVKKKIMVSGNFHIGKKHQFLSKIAHAYACGCLGTDGFNPYLKDIILNDNFEVGCYFISHAEVFGSFDALHRIRLFEEPISVKQLPLFNGATKRVWIVHLQLFSFLETPIYEIVVGSAI